MKTIIKKLIDAAARKGPEDLPQGRSDNSTVRIPNGDAVHAGEKPSSVFLPADAVIVGELGTVFLPADAINVGGPGAVFLPADAVAVQVPR